jgi:hypothetical protein
VPITESDRIFGTLHCGSAAESVLNRATFGLDMMAVPSNGSRQAGAQSAHPLSDPHRLGPWNGRVATGTAPSNRMNHSSRNYWCRRRLSTGGPC